MASGLITRFLGEGTTASRPADPDIGTAIGFYWSTDDDKLSMWREGAWAEDILSGGSYQPLDSDLTAIAALTTDTFGRSLLELTTGSGARNKIGLALATAAEIRAGAESLRSIAPDQLYAAGVTARTIAFFFTTTPTDAEVLLLYTAAQAMTLADDFAGSVGDCGTNPTSSFAMDVQVNGVSVGTITIATVGTFTFATSGGAVSLAIGDVVKVVGPGTADVTCANVSISLLGVLA